jgi:release factor glutamine methyltransferase
MSTIEFWLRAAATRLQAIGVESPLLEARVILGDTLQQDRTWLIVHGQEVLSDSGRIRAEDMLSRRLDHVPLAYLVGEREFYGRSFKVSPATLIPRADTETLIEAALEVLPEGAMVLDLGTGSGCIAITLKLERPDLHLIASDISEEALEIARQNAERLGAEVDFQLSDGFKSIQGLEFFHLVSNPPYVETGADLAPEVRNHEPAQALFAGEDGLDFYRRLASEAPDYLSLESWVLLEVGHTQADAVISLFPDYQARIWQDLAGIRRVFGLKRRD